MPGAASTAPTPGVRVWLRLRYRPPLCPDNLFGHLAATAVPGVEEWRDGAYRRAVRLPHGPAVLEVGPPQPGTGAAWGLPGGVWLSDRADEPAAVALARRLLDLDADPAAIDAVLGRDPVLAPWVSAAPGRRVPGAVDAAEFALRAVLGQQVSTAAARTHAGRLVHAHGTPFTDPGGGLTHLFPTPDQLADLDPATLALPQQRRRTVTGLIAALVTGELDPADPADFVRRLAARPGIGPWTVSTVAMRALGDGDAFLPTDLGVLRAAATLGLPTRTRDLTAYAERWRPFRAYAVQHLWATGKHEVNRLPPSSGGDERRRAGG